MIKREIENIISLAKSKNITMKDYTAFEVLSLQYLCLKTAVLEPHWHDVISMITDGSNDGGIDFVYYDSEQNSVIIGQNKYSENISTEDVATEVTKIIRTLDDFNKGNTGRYSAK